MRMIDMFTSPLQRPRYMYHVMTTHTIMSLVFVGIPSIPPKATFSLILRDMKIITNVNQVSENQPPTYHNLIHIRINEFVFN